MDCKAFDEMLPKVRKVTTTVAEMSACLSHYLNCESCRKAMHIRQEARVKELVATHGQEFVDDIQKRSEEVGAVFGQQILEDDEALKEVNEALAHTTWKRKR